MEPAVPFALLGAVQLLLIGAFVGLAAAALLRRSSAGVLVALGAAVLAAVEVRTALRLGVPGSDDLALARAAASLVLAAGLYSGGLGPRRLPSALYGVVVPLAAAGGPAAFAAGASALAALAAVWNRRDAVGVWVAAGFSLFAVAAGLAVTADSGQGAPQAVLLLRGLGAVAVLVALGLLAQTSLLSKVVGTILVGVLAMAIAAVGVVGTVVVSSYDKQNRELVVAARDARLNALQENVGATAKQIVTLAPKFCDAANLQAAQENCNGYLTYLAPPQVDDFVVRVPRVGSPVGLAGRRNRRLVLPTRSEMLGLRSLPAVKAVLDGAGAQRANTQIPSNVRLSGSPPSVAVIAVVAARKPGQQLPDDAYVYGIRIDDNYTQNDFDTGQSFALTLLAGDPLQVVASNASVRQGRELLAIVRAAGADRYVPDNGLVLASQGSRPTIALKPIMDSASTPQRVGLIAVSRGAGPALDAERRALQLLLVTALLALIAVGVAAAVLGRRTVEPVRRLTAAAARVAAGDLTTTSAMSGRDEVGTLSRTFDGMTASLAQLTGDLRSSAVHLSTVLASMSDGLLATDADGVVTSVNRAALSMLGLEEQDVLGERLDIVADVRDAGGSQLADPTLRLRDEIAEVFRPDGSKVAVHVAITPLEGVEGVVMVLRDTTREREVERMKTEFLSNVSHELRTPLTPIRGFAEILVGKPGLPSEKVTAFATTIRDESLKMNRVVDLLVDVAALEAGRVSVSPRPVSVKDLLDARVELWQSRAPLRATDFKRRVAAGLPAVHVDPTWVGKALDEFLDNAVKYTPPGTPITLVGSWSPDGMWVRVAVKDAGPGIAEDHHGALFTSFEQVDGSATRKVGGLGLGLSFVRRLAEDAGYPLSVTTKLGKGAEFALDLPVSDEQPALRRR
ncbi:MAG: two-component system, OmpR family, phosphate regulon sensor histidine kinase PhoR [Frankiales bacterium]|nr:two-component system, OmpR family, phosphate regulon sensor histidine kinase PhoR [Frankiales bacterium]